MSIFVFVLHLLNWKYTHRLIKDLLGISATFITLKINSGYQFKLQDAKCWNWTDDLQDAKCWNWTDFQDRLILASLQIIFKNSKTTV